MKRSCFLLWTFALAWPLGCNGVEVGHGNFDGSFFEDTDAGTHKTDAGKKSDAGAKARADEDAGAEGEDSGVIRKDSGVGTSNMDAGANHDAGTSADSGAISPGDVPTLFAKSVCGALDSCMGSILLLDYLKGTPCEDLITKQQSDRDLHWLSDSISAGRVLFRAAHLADCEAALTAFGCDVQSRRLPQACEDALEGQVAVGGACSIDYDCMGNAYCDKGLDTETCPGSCAAPQTEGLPCKASTECDDRLICRGGMCVTPLKEGDACDNDVCPPGLVCQGQPGSRKCQSLGVYSGKENDPCDAYGTLCMPGLVCASQSAQDTSGICQKPAAKDGTCRRAVPNQCPSTQYCKSAQAGVSDRAQPGVDGVCADLPVDGESCATLMSCGPGAVCVNDTCHALQAAGGSCDDSSECYSASCENSMCALALECQL